MGKSIVTKQWHENPEYTFEIWCDWTNWALPFEIRWQNCKDKEQHGSFLFCVTFLCIGFSFEIWRWAE